MLVLTLVLKIKIEIKNFAYHKREYCPIVHWANTKMPKDKMASVSFPTHTRPCTFLSLSMTIPTHPPRHSFLVFLFLAKNFQGQLRGMITFLVICKIFVKPNQRSPHPASNPTNPTYLCTVNLSSFDQTEFWQFFHPLPVGFFLHLNYQAQFNEKTMPGNN